VSDLDILTPIERQQLLEEWTDTASSIPASGLIHDLFEEQVTRNPDSPAVEFNGRSLTLRRAESKCQPTRKMFA